MEMTAEKEAVKILSSYVLYKNIIDTSDKRNGIEDEMVLRAEMFKIRRSIMSLPNSKEKILLYNRYIRGETMETCAELLGISRRSVFRLSHRAMALYIAYNQEDENVRVLT